MSKEVGEERGAQGGVDRLCGQDLGAYRMSENATSMMRCFLRRLQPPLTSAEA